MSLTLLASEAFPFGEGLFETMRICGGIPQHFESHWERLKTSSGQLGFPFAFRMEECLDRLDSMIGGLGRAPMAARISYLPKRFPGRLCIQFPALATKHGAWILHPVQTAPHPLAGHKFTSRRRYENLHAEAVRKGADDALFITLDGEFLETTRSNIFFVMEGLVRTPAADGRILPGLMRKKIMAAASSAGIPAIEEPVPESILCRCDEIFLSNGIRGIVEVRGIAGKWEKKSRESPVTKKLKEKISFARPNACR